MDLRVVRFRGKDMQDRCYDDLFFFFWGGGGGSAFLFTESRLTRDDVLRWMWGFTKLGAPTKPPNSRIP